MILQIKKNEKEIDRDISLCYTLYIEVRYIVVHKRGEKMDAHIKKVYIPMTESSFYILLCLRQASHGYGIVQRVEALTDGQIRLSPGTMYGSLFKMEKDGLIRFVREEDKRKIYCITELGEQILELEMKRIERLYKNMKEARGDEK